MTRDDGEALATALFQDSATLGLDLSGKQINTLIGYIDLLHRWNGVYNLTAIRDRGAMLTQHVVDCLAAIRPLQRAMSTPSGHLLDVGSGGGLPGFVIATVLENVQVTCVDTVGKKAAFVQQAAGELCLKNLRSVHARVERMAHDGFEVVTSRAFSSLPDLIRLTEPLLTSNGVWMAMKGRVPTPEIQALPSTIDMFHVEPLTVPRLAAERSLVWMRRRAIS